jgi:4'-phosphopantetheinyl transferase EntD
MKSSAINQIDTTHSCSACPPARDSEKNLSSEKLYSHLRTPLHHLVVIAFFFGIGQVHSFAPLSSPTVDRNMRSLTFINFANVRVSQALSNAKNIKNGPFISTTARYVANEVVAGQGMYSYTERLASIHTGASSQVDAADTKITVEASDTTTNNTPYNSERTENLVDSAVALSQYENVFSFDLPEGKCVGLKLLYPNQAPTVTTSLDRGQIGSNSDHWIKRILHPDEVQYGFDRPSENARMTFYIGRLAMRTALAEMKGVDPHTAVECEDRLGGFTKLPNVSTDDQSILKDEHGRPQVPHGFIGSISHKQTTGVALISTLPPGKDNGNMASPTIGVGVDIEQSFSRRRNIATKILTPNELEDLGMLDSVTRDEEVLLRFSLKESVYKAMHPLVCQFVGFQEAEIKPHNDGTATVTLNLKSGKHERFQEVKAHWRRIEGDYFLTSSSVTLKEL